MQCRYVCANAKEFSSITVRYRSYNHKGLVQCTVVGSHQQTAIQQQTAKKKKDIKRRATVTTIRVSDTKRIICSTTNCRRSNRIHPNPVFLVCPVNSSSCFREEFNQVRRFRAQAHFDFFAILIPFFNIQYHCVSYDFLTQMYCIFFPLLRSYEQILNE